MKILFGKQQKEIETGDLAERIQGHYPVHIDVGTGSGRLVLKQSCKDPSGFYIGMDPSAESMRENSVKAAKRNKKTGLGNLMFVVGSIEFIPDGLAETADIVSVILPWGSLRDGIVKADFQVLSNLRKLGKPGSKLEILVGYDEIKEPREMEKRLLPVLSRLHFCSLAPAYRIAGINIHGIKVLLNDELKTIESDWAKRLAYGAARSTFRLDCTYT